MAGAGKPRANPVAWLVLGIPAATILAGIATLWVAAGGSAVDASPDPVRRMAQVQQVALDADEVAAREGLSATLYIEGEVLRLELRPAPGTVTPVLQLVHPIESDADVALDFEPGPDGWRHPGGYPDQVAWNLRLVAPDGRWRLVGRHVPGADRIELAPAVPAP